MALLCDRSSSGGVDRGHTYLFEMEAAAGSPHSGALGWYARRSNEGLPSLDTTKQPYSISCGE